LRAHRPARRGRGRASASMNGTRRRTVRTTARRCTAQEAVSIRFVVMPLRRAARPDVTALLEAGRAAIVVWINPGCRPSDRTG
jgi:hypothetical protein